MKNRGRFVRHAVCAASIMVCSGLLWGQTSLNSISKTPGKTNTAVINIKNSSGVTAGDAELISDRLRGELFNTGKVNVMEREQMQEILKEQGFQQSGACTNEACMVEIGQLLGVEQLVTGSLGKVGSMFLVNMRIIDVKTAKIMKVVSVDIKGSIEEVVGALPGIASQLVGPAAPAAQARALEKKTEEKPIEKVKEEKPQAEEKKEEPAVASAPEVSDERMEKNKNRFGVRLGVNIFGVRPKRIFHYADYDTNYFLYTTGDSSIDFDNNNSSMKITRSPLVNYNVKFVLKAGPVITIDIGAGYSHQETDYEGTTLKQAHAANIFSFPSFGINFVKRWYPLKLNVGLLADFNILNYSVDYYSWDYNAASFVRDTTVGWLGLNGGFGARAGLEIMAGKHVGFNVDFVYYYSSFTTFTETIESTNLSGYTTYKSDWSWELTMPPIAIGLGVNFYF